MLSVITGKDAGTVRIWRDELLKQRESSAVSQLDLVVGALGAQSGLSFVQVGANDGRTGDPVFHLVHEYGAKALLIEPQPWLIDDLKRNYASFGGDLVIECLAISTDHPGTDEDRELKLYILRHDLWDEYIQRVGRHPSAIFSADKKQLFDRIKPRLKLSDQECLDAIQILQVKSESLEHLMTRTGFSDAEVVQIDCEGWDFEVIKSLGELRPKIINFESFNLSEFVWEEFIVWSKRNDYGFVRGRMDTLAIHGFPHRIDHTGRIAP
jgi:FkbM family methyltransferase